MGFPDFPENPTALASLAFVLTVAAAIVAASHALLFKRHSRAAFGWMVTALFVPVVGPLAYAIFGVNRVGKRAQQVARDRTPPGASDSPTSSIRAQADVPAAYAVLDRISASVTGLPLTGGGAIRCLVNGDQAFPRMLEAIDRAERSVWLCTYIFDSDHTGRAFVTALAAAHKRGVDVRVLLDGVGEWYGRPRIGGLLREGGVPYARFLPPRLLPPSAHINLRNHRKILVVDGDRAFTGGMNIGDRHLLEGEHAGARHRDMHFELGGPVVAQLAQVFAADWWIASGDALVLPDPPPPAGGTTLARAIVDGPDVDFDKLLLVLLGAFSAARESIRILTPYFVPPREMLAVLHAAALRGVEVQIVIPERCNLPFVRWAMHHLAWEPIKRGVEIYERPGDFAHTKLIVIDDRYVQVGSANLDDRSLRLNFELMVEVYDPTFGAHMAELFTRERDASRRLTLADVDGRSLPRRLRDGFFWLLSPYL